MNILYRIGVSLLIAGTASAFGAGELEERDKLASYGMHFAKESISFYDSDIYVQKVNRAEGVSRQVELKHGTYKSGSFEMYSQDPFHAEIDGVSFYDYISTNMDVVDTGPMYTRKSEMVLCWIGKETTLIEVEKTKIAEYLNDVGRSFDNACVSNALAEEYWLGRDRHVEIR